MSKAVVYNKMALAVPYCS